MNRRMRDDHGAEIGAYVEAFESARERDEKANLDAFLPAADHDRFLAILCELVRVDLEWRWDRGERPDLGGYRERFPDLFSVAEFADEVAFEFDRLKGQASHSSSSSKSRRPVAPARSSDFLVGKVIGYDDASLARGVSPEDDDLLRELSRSDPALADRVARAVSAWPEVGSQFLGFRLELELGRGTFGRVFLARQGELADRQVALKVAPDMAGESRMLAQLQHTNVVPIYSVHRGGPFEAVCMPYLGSTTLAHVIADLGRYETIPDSGAGLLGSFGGGKAAATLPDDAGLADGSPGSPFGSQLPAPGVDRLRGLGYAEAVLSIGGRLAEGLAHAHDRGIFHRD